MKTRIAVLLDRSGSMQDKRSDHEGGLKSFVEDNKSLAGEVTFTLALFDGYEPFELIYDDVPITSVDKIELVPRGSTPLLDAVGKMVSHLQELNQKNPSDDIILMIITDGEENTSQEWTRDRVKSLIDEKQKAGWQVLFLGANLDKFEDAHSMNVGVVRCASVVNTGASYKRMSEKFAAYNSLRSSGCSVEASCSTLDFSDLDRSIMGENVNEAVSSNSSVATDSQASGGGDCCNPGGCGCSNRPC